MVIIFFLTDRDSQTALTSKYMDFTLYDKIFRINCQSILLSLTEQSVALLNVHIEHVFSTYIVYDAFIIQKSVNNTSTSYML